MNGDRCRYMHMKEYENRVIPPDVFDQIQKDNLKKNMIIAIREAFPEEADKIEKENQTME